MAVVRRRVLTAMVGATVLSVFIYGGYSDLAHTDWPGKSSISQLETWNSAIDPPQTYQNRVQHKRMNRLTVISVSKRSYSRLALRSLETHYDELSSKMGWAQKSRKSKSDELTIVYCDGRISHVIALTPHPKGTTVFTGTYWQSNTRSEVYCNSWKGPI